MTVLIGIDSGGTFTDVSLFDRANGDLKVGKVPSTPDDPSVGIINALNEILRIAGKTEKDIDFLGHGTTVGTNALIQLKGSTTALITTQGFKDLLEIGRQKRPSLYDLQADKPIIMVPRHLRMEVAGRLKFDGSVVQPLDLRQIPAIVDSLRRNKVSGVAVCLLYSFIDDAHEETVRKILERELPGVFISISSEIAPEFREFERMSTVVVNTYLGPIMKVYIDRLEAGLRERGVSVAPKLTQSNGGVISFEAAARQPVRTVLSGPSTGIVSAQRIAGMMGESEIITFDMGGTSTDVALMHKGICGLSGQASVHGYPLKVPMLDIHTVGAGGGSIAYVDNGGLMKVGPESAGAFPGPICYGNGNTNPTVTDANLVLQILNPDRFLDGRMQLQRGKSVAAIEALANRLNVDVMEAAQGIISVATSNMAKAIRVISVQKGYDPRDYLMMAFGGAGPLHAARLARELEMKRIVIPRYPGVLCAMGLLLTDLRSDFMASRLLSLHERPIVALNNIFDSLVADAKKWFADEGIGQQAQSIDLMIDMRYAGQNYELSIPVEYGTIDETRLDSLKHAFFQAHKKQYGFAVDEPVQLVTYRAVATGRSRSVQLPQYPIAGESPDDALTGFRDIWYAETGSWRKTPIYDRNLLKAGNALAGPAVIEQMDTTTFVLADMRVSVDTHLNLIMEDTRGGHADN